MNEEQPVEQAAEPLTPIFLHHNKVINGKLWLCGVGNKEAKVMFVAPNALEEEANTVENVGYGKTKERTPRLLDCGHGVLLKRIALREGLDLEQCWYTTLIKYLPDDKRHRTKPPKAMIAEAMPFLRKEIERIQPSIIVAVGKLAFDQLVDFKAKESDVCGGWFYNKEFNAKVYMIPHITQVAKPEKYERFALDFRTIWTMLNTSDKVQKQEFTTKIIRNSYDLADLVVYLAANNHKVLSVDSI